MTKQQKIKQLAKAIEIIIKQDPAMCLGFMGFPEDQATALYDLEMAMVLCPKITTLLEDEDGD